MEEERRGKGGGEDGGKEKERATEYGAVFIATNNHCNRMQIV